jgi:FtsP/CotA-like multicopper oxidase with cupredoxin domain
VYRRFIHASAAFAAALISLAICEGAASAPESPHAMSSTSAPRVCPRPAAGAEVAEPPELLSHAGVLNVDLDYVSSMDGAGRRLFCFMTPGGLESPTLHVRPGDQLNIRLRNLVQASSKAATMAMSIGPDRPCGAAAMDSTSVNIHFHGVDLPPDCHVDDVLRTFVNAGQSFDYHVAIPKTQSPGLYWYHPHVHGQSEQAVKGGASGAIVVDGIETIEPIVARLPERTLIVRDQIVSGEPAPGGSVPTSDISLNYVPIAYPALTPAAIAIMPGRREFWRVLNASAETVLDIALVYDGVDQPLELVGLDGAPLGSGNGATTGKTLRATHILIPAAGRAEFVVEDPSEKVRHASLVTRSIPMGPDGDSDIARPLAILTRGRSLAALAARPMRGATGSAPISRGSPDDIDRAPISARRRLYFSETLPDPYDPTSQARYFITVDGATPRVFDPADPPAIITTQGGVETWTIENRSREMHEFHIHQIHFKLIGRDGASLPPDQRQYLDTTQIPYWPGSGPYPSITVLVDFRHAAVGDLLFHCHMLDHEDGGMMGIVRVLPEPGRRQATRGRPRVPAPPPA